MTQDTQLQNRIRKNLALHEKRKAILSLPPEEALDMILSSGTPGELIQSFPAQDLHFLVHDIGLADAIPVLALAHSEQWGYFIDIETWERDRLNPDAVTHWFKVLLMAAPKRLVRWLVAERLEFLELYLFKNVEVIIREENEDPSDFPDGFFTVDDYFFIRIKEKPEPFYDESGELLASQEDVEDVIREILSQILALDHYLYQNILLEAMSVIPAESEEDDFRLRNVRLAEKGFLPIAEALDVYSPLDPGQIEKASVKKKPLSPLDPFWAPAPMVYFREIRDRNLFSDSLEEIGAHYNLEEVEKEFAALCNQIIAADQVVVRDKEALSHIVKKAGSYLSLAMEILLKREENQGTDSRMAILMNHSLKDLFRVGLGRVMRLKWKASKITRDGWFAARKLPLTFWGEEGLGVLGGLLVKKPVYYDNFANGTLYREFTSLSDVEKTNEILEDIRGYDELLSIMSPRIDHFRNYHVTFSSLLLTLRIHDKSGAGEDTEGPVTMDQVRVWFSELWEPGDRDFESPRVSIRQEEKNQVLSWLSRRTGFTEQEISNRMGRALTSLFSAIENDYGAVKTDDLEARYIPHICIQGQQPDP